MVAEFRSYYRETHRHLKPDLTVVSDPFIDDVEERAYKQEWSTAVRFLLSHDPSMPREEEKNLIKDFKRSNRKLSDLRLTALVRSGQVVCKGADCDHRHTKYEEKLAGPDLDRVTKEVDEERARLLGEMEGAMSYGSHVAYLLKQRNYERIGDLFQIFNTYHQGGTLIDTYALPVLQTATREWRDPESKEFLKAWGEFCLGNGESFESESFDRLREGLVRFWAAKSLKDRGKEFGGPKLRNLMTFWAFLLNPVRFLFLKSNRVVKFLSADRDLLEDPFTAARYGRIQEEARRSLELLGELGPRDMLDLQTILYVCGDVGISPPGPQFALGQIAWNCNGWTGPIPHPEDRKYQPTFARATENTSWDVFNFARVPGSSDLLGFVTSRKPRTKLEDGGLILLIAMTAHDGGEKGPWKAGKEHVVGLYGNVEVLDPGVQNPHEASMQCNLRADGRLSTILHERGYVELDERLVKQFRDRKWRPDFRQNFISPFQPSDAKVLLIQVIERHRELKPADDADVRRIERILNSLERVYRRYFEGGGSMPSMNAGVEGLEETIRTFGQLILYGPPGTGKTYVVDRVAEGLLGTSDLGRDRRFKRIVFHPGFEYEQFIRGLRPLTNKEKEVEFRTVEGHFLQMCWRALFLAYLDLQESGRRCQHKMDDVVEHTRCLIGGKGAKARICVLAIDEINRGNLPALLGELIYALERDKRGTPVEVPYPLPEPEEFRQALGSLPPGEVKHGEDFYAFLREKGWHHKIVVPHNLLVSGTMNTSDRSIGSIDAAIRRRFPVGYLGPDPELVKAKWGPSKLGGGGFLGAALASALTAVNTIFKESSDQPEVRVGGLGHSYLLPKAQDHASAHGETPCDCVGNLGDQIRLFVQPLLREYHELGIGYANAERLKDLVDELERQGQGKKGLALVQTFLSVVNKWLDRK